MSFHQTATFRKFGQLITTLFLAAAFVFAAAPARAQDFVLKFGNQTLNDIQHEYMNVFKTELEKATNGKIKVEIYPASQLGAFNRMLEGLRLGTVEGLIAPSEFYAGADARYQGLAMTGLFNDVNHARRVLDLPEARQTINATGEGRGFVTVGLVPYDMQMINSKVQMTKLADFAGKRIRVLASEAEQAEVKSLGASTIPMALPETLPALQQGTIDGVTAVIGVFNAFRYYDTAPYLLDTRLWALISVAQISKVWFDKLPPDLQKAVRETGAKIESDLHKWQVARIQADRENWVKNGGKIITLAPAEQAEAQKRVAEAIQPLLAKDAGLKTFYDKIKSLAATVK
jgi:TRAP-type C4-dicarboxylate transport system substrate-binding protein